MSHELSEIVVGSRADDQFYKTHVRRISLADLVQQDALAAADLIRLIPSAYMQTNSRGESLIYLRNADERQVATFLDGASLNIPWDNRIDLSMIPGGVVGEIEVSRGAPSVLYGTNVIGGAVNMQTRRLARPGSLFEAQALYGTQGRRNLGGTALYKNSSSAVLAAGNYTSSNGLAISADADLPFSQVANELRTNTDRQLANAYVRYSRSVTAVTKLGVSLLHVSADKGIAPESHLDPAIDRVRFWRYPAWINTMLIVNAESRYGAGSDIRATIWLGQYRQTIDQYQSSRYGERTESEDGRDRSAGLRIVSASDYVGGTVRFALNFSTSRHREDIVVFAQNGLISNSTRNNYQQHLYSVGAEYNKPVSEKSSLLTGVSLDGASTPETGDKPARSRMTAVGLNASLITDFGQNLVLHASAGRKVRFPTMRELFGDALDTFQVNDELGPETAIMADVGLEKSSGNASAGVTVFARRTFDTIDRINVLVEGGQRRKRVNLDGSRVVGVEITGVANLAELITLDGHLMWSRSVAFREDIDRPLNEKPALLSTISMQARSRWGGVIRITSIITGKAYSLLPDNTQSQLSKSLVFNVRGALRRYFKSSNIYIEAFTGVNNVTDELTLPQLGLPGPGREIHVGLNISY